MVLAAVKTDGFALRTVSEELRNDKEVIHAALSSRASGIENLPMEYYENQDLIKECLAINSYAIAYLITNPNFPKLIAFALKMNPFIAFGKTF